MKTIVYWITNDRERKREVMDKLGIRYTSVNGESEYKGDLKELEQYISEGLIKVRMKEYEEVRRPKVYINTKQGKPIDSKTIGRSSGARKV